MGEDRHERSQRRSVAGAAALRLGFAAWFLARPDAVARALQRPPSAGLRRIARLVAAREVVLGLGTATALARRRPARGWVVAMAAADAVNGTATALAGLAGVVPARRAAGLAAFDLSGTLSEALLARRLPPSASRPQRPPHRPPQRPPQRRGLRLVPVVDGGRSTGPSERERGS